LAAKVSGLDICYDVGAGTHPLLGRRMPHLALAAGARSTSSTELLRTGRGVLLDLADNAWLRRRAEGWRARVDIVTAAPVSLTEHSPLVGTTAVLLRPDGYVAWAAPGSYDGLNTALDRWFGRPTRQTTGDRG
jgi:bifunctional hydroxylase/dehydrase